LFELANYVNKNLLSRSNQYISQWTVSCVNGWPDDLWHKMLIGWRMSCHKT